MPQAGQQPLLLLFPYPAVLIHAEFTEQDFLSTVFLKSWSVHKYALEAEPLYEKLLE